MRRITRKWLKAGAFVFMVASFSLAPHVRVLADQCYCSLYEEYDGIGYFECYDDQTCDNSKVDCANGFCGGVVDWDDTYCGNSELQVMCNY
jgi:hypothetical protein